MGGVAGRREGWEVSGWTCELPGFVRVHLHHCACPVPLLFFVLVVCACTPSSYRPAASRPS